MARLWKRIPQTVRPRSVRRTPVLFCLSVFGLTAIVVYGWGYESWIPTNPRPTYAATAYVAGRPRPDMPATGEVRVPMVVSDIDRRRAEDAANARAERYVQDGRAEWKRRTEGPVLKAREAVEKARRELAQNEARLEAFRREMTEAAKPQAAVEPQEKLPPPMVDNPEWVELDRQFTELQRRHDDLLKDRTPLHPAVQEVAWQIEELQRQMANMPRQIPGKLPAASESVARVERATVGGQIAEQDREKLAKLTAAVETARRACQDAGAAEKRAIAQQQAGPQYTIVCAQAVEVPPPPDYGWRRLLQTALVAGVLMACGVGSVSTGASIEPPVGSVAQVQAAAMAPVVGTIPADEPVANPAKMSRRQSRLRRTLVAMGLMLIAACPAAAIWGVMGL